MRAKTVDFQRGGSPKDAMGIGLGEKALHFLRWVRDDYQFDKSNEGYMGYLNVGIDMMDDRDLIEGFAQFVTGWQRYLGVMRDMGIYLMSPPTEDEAIFYDEPEISGREALSESANFERGKDPKDAMGIGHKAMLQKRASEIGWDWYGDEEHPEEEVIGLEEYRGRHGEYNIKVARIPNEVGPTYYAVADTGEPYFDGPAFYNTPEEAIDDGRSFIRDYERELDD